MPPEAAGGNGISLTVVATTAGAVAGIVLAGVLAVILWKRRAAKGRDDPSDPSGVYTFAVEESRYLMSDCDEFARADARPPLPEESESSLVGPDSEIGSRPGLPGHASFAHTGQRSVIMRNLWNLD
jgi:hypothetical protein